MDELLNLYLIEQESVSVKKAAILMGKVEQFVIVGLRNNRFPFGTAVKMNSNWSYYISPKLFYDYIGYKEIPKGA